MGSTLLAVAVGGVFGYAWYHFVGCETGACVITARWWTSTSYGAVMGYLAKMSWFG